MLFIAPEKHCEETNMERKANSGFWSHKFLSEVNNEEICCQVDCLLLTMYVFVAYTRDSLP